MARANLYYHVINERRLFFILFLIAAYILPVFLIFFGIVSYEFRFHFLVIFTIIMGVYSIGRKHSFRRLGIRFDNLSRSIIVYCLLSFLFSIMVFLSAKVGLIQEAKIPDWNPFFIFYIFISAPAQEFIYRSLLFAEMRYARINHPIMQVAISAISYSFLHIFYCNITTLWVTLVIGVIWGFVYRRFPNFFGVSLSHAILGALSISLGLI